MIGEGGVCIVFVTGEVRGFVGAVGSLFDDRAWFERRWYFFPCKDGGEDVMGVMDN